MYDMRYSSITVHFFKTLILLIKRAFCRFQGCHNNSKTGSSVGNIRVKKCLLILLLFYLKPQGRVTSVGSYEESLETLSLHLIRTDRVDIFVAFLRIIVHIENK